MELPAGKNIRLFINPHLERLTHVHPLLPALMWGPVVVVSFLWGIFSGTLGWTASLELAAVGGFAWTLAEYLLHRFIFHFKPRSALGRRVAFLIHGIHHSDPRDARRLVMPPTASLIFAVIFSTLFIGLMGAAFGRPFFAGFVAGYLCYDYIHFSVHFMNFRSPVFKRLRENHMRHHFSTPNRRFGVSTTFWDYVFGTRG